MKFCDEHWDKLKKLTEDNGLMHLVHKDGKSAVDSLRKHVDGTGTLDDYDPLMDAHNMLTSNALKCGGLYLLEGELCPMCEADKNAGDGTADEWMVGCTDAVLKYCQEKGLTAPVQ